MMGGLIATLLRDPFRVSLAEIADLTDWQIKELYFHATDENGKIKIPEPVTEAAEVTSEQADLIIAEIAKAFRIAPEKVEALKRRRDERKRQQAASQPAQPGSQG